MAKSREGASKGKDASLLLEAMSVLKLSCVGALCTRLWTTATAVPFPGAPFLPPRNVSLRCLVFCALLDGVACALPGWRSCTLIFARTSPTCPSPLATRRRSCAR